MNTYQRILSFPLGIKVFLFTATLAVACTSYWWILEHLVVTRLLKVFFTLGLGMISWWLFWLLIFYLPPHPTKPFTLQDLPAPLEWLSLWLLGLFLLTIGTIKAGVYLIAGLMLVVVLTLISGFLLLAHICLHPKSFFLNPRIFITKQFEKLGLTIFYVGIALEP